MVENALSLIYQMNDMENQSTIAKEMKRWFHPSTFEVSLNTRIRNRGILEMGHRMILHNTTCCGEPKTYEELMQIATRNQKGNMKQIARNLQLEYKNGLIPPETEEDYCGNGGANYNLGLNRK